MVRGIREMIYYDDEPDYMEQDVKSNEQAYVGIRNYGDDGLDCVLVSSIECGGPGCRRNNVQ